MWLSFYRQVYLREWLPTAAKKIWEGEIETLYTSDAKLHRALSSITNEHIALTWRGIMPIQLIELVKTITGSHKKAQKVAAHISTTVQDLVVEVWKQAQTIKREKERQYTSKGYNYARMLNEQGLLLPKTHILAGKTPDETYESLKKLNKTHKENIMQRSD